MFECLAFSNLSEYPSNSQKKYSIICIDFQSFRLSVRMLNKFATLPNEIYLNYHDLECSSFHQPCLFSLLEP
ncbi:hypothetical protein BpHYR1_035120 [Brachionus plicatilis]|uniref:Uncharacterized protein n=1 Tax=Brachionus plicatilis TaxID=10195 RepID=A0A3M7RJ35_BRAPC|nr:hypothetical protein BpHYR1_035120 [Brachionus plicatilis]